MDNDDQWSEELRITSPDGRPIEWVAGAYYFYQYQSNRLYQQYGPDAGIFTGALWNYFEVPGNPRVYGATVRYKF